MWINYRVSRQTIQNSRQITYFSLPEAKTSCRKVCILVGFGSLSKSVGRNRVKVQVLSLYNWTNPQHTLHNNKIRQLFLTLFVFIVLGCGASNRNVFNLSICNFCSDFDWRLYSIRIFSFKVHPERQ